MLFSKLNESLQEGDSYVIVVTKAPNSLVVTSKHDLNGVSTKLPEFTLTALNEEDIQCLDNEYAEMISRPLSISSSIAKDAKDYAAKLNEKRLDEAKERSSSSSSKTKSKSQSNKVTETKSLF
jgi:hypothetical protein